MPLFCTGKMNTDQGVFTIRLCFKQRLFSWFDSYDIYNESGNIIYTVQGRASWGHRLEIYNAAGAYLGQVKEEVFSFMPRFRIYLGDTCIGEIKKKFTFFKPSFFLDCNGWQVDGDFMEWEYRVISPRGQPVMTASKELFRLTDTYVLDIVDPANALLCLMIVLAIDAAKCPNG